MLRARTLDNIYEKRTLRVIYGPTQATPYHARLDPDFDRTAGALSGANAIAGAKAAIIPGLVATKMVGETVTLSGAYHAASRAFGLFANFVGGDLDDYLAGEDFVGVWRGVGSVYQVLAPAFSDANNLSTIAAAEGGNDDAEEVYLNSNAKGQLEAAAAGAAVANTTARLISYDSADAITIELLV